MVKLSEVAQINPRTQAIPGDTPVSFVGMAQLNAESARATDLETRPFEEVSKGYTIFANRDILAAKITPCWENGKVGQAELVHSVGVGSTEFHVIRPSEQLDHRYVMHFLRQASIRERGTLRMTGSGGQRRVPASFVQDLQIPLPPIEEQRRIAAILDQADALRTQRRAQLAHLDALPQAIFHEMFGDPLATKNHRTPLGDIAKILTGNSPSRTDPENFGTGIDWIKSDNLGSTFTTPAREKLTEIGSKRARIAPPGSILITCIAGSRTSIGKCSINADSVSFNQQINAILPSENFDSMFMLWQIKSCPELVRSASTGGMKGLVSKSSLAAIRVLNPPMDQQQEFASYVARCLRTRGALRRQATSADDLFASLQSRAFRGEL